MENLKVIIKPRGVIALSVLLSAAVVWVAAPKLAARSTSGGVAGPAPNRSSMKLTAPAPVLSPDMDENERREKGLIRELNETPGQARDWLFLGPILPGGEPQTGEPDEARMERLLSVAYLPNEARYQPRESANVNVNGKSLSWRKLRGSAFDFKNMYAAPDTPVSTLKHRVTYGMTYIDSPKAAKKVLRFRSDDGAIVWLNGEQVFKTTKIRGVEPEDLIPITLREGRNTLMVKVGQGQGGWGLVVHMEDAM